MALILRQLRLAARTADGDFITDLPFERRLVVLRADNSMGKSTCMQAIIYALGMDGVLQQGQRVPLPPAMTETLEDEAGREHAVLESYVELEVENEAGRVATLQRFAKRVSGDHRLIRVWEGPQLTDPDPERPFDELLARVAGSGTRELGIGPYLSQFLGWNLPQILMPSGAEVPLYAELIFPLFYVEQRRGWGGIQSSMPSTYGIPDVRKRAIEFVLSLKLYEQEQRAAALRQLIAQRRAEWRGALAAVGLRIRAMGLALRGLSGDEIPTSVTYPAVISIVSGRTLDEELGEARADAQISSAVPVAIVSDVTTESDQFRLDQALREFEEIQARAVHFGNDVSRQQAELNGLRVHINELEVERRRTQDRRTLERFGSDQPWFQTPGECPVCHQNLPLTLVGRADRLVMTADDNLNYLNDQLAAYRAIETELERAIEVGSRAQEADANSIRSLRSEIRALRTTLLSPASVPSVADVERRLRLENRIRDLEQVDAYVGELVNQLRDIRDELDATELELSLLPESGLSVEDEERVGALERSFLEQNRAVPTH